MKFYKSLQEQTETERNALFNVPIICKSLSGQITRASYIAFLTEAYHHVRHTVPLLMACGTRLSDQQEWLRVAVAEYIREEIGHQEWILNDIAACGADSEKVRNGKPSLATELMVAYAYDMINRINPLGFFGMVQVLEGTSIALATRAAEAVQKSLKLPDQAFSYLRSHGSLDQEHIVFFESLMNRIENRREQEIIVHSAKVFYKLYADIFRSFMIESDTQIAA